MSLCFKHVTCPPLPAEDSTWNCAYPIKLSNNLPWLTKEIIWLIRKRNDHFRNTVVTVWDDYLIRNRVVAELRLAKRRFFTRIHPHNQWILENLWLWKWTSLQHLSSIVATTYPEKACLLNATFTNCLNYSLPGLNIKCGLSSWSCSSWMSMWATLVYIEMTSQWSHCQMALCHSMLMT